MKRSSSSGQAAPQATHAGGQAALILIMIMAVVGAASVGVASRSVENLRSSEIEGTSTQSLKEAESALELALQTGGDISSDNYSAQFTVGGGDGFVSDQVEAGDVVQVSLVGAAGVTGMNIYWNSSAAVKVEVLNSGGGAYSVKYYTADQDGVRRGLNKFSIPSGGSSLFKGKTFGNRLTISPFSPPAGQTAQMVRITLLYQGSSIGVEPIGGTLAGQMVTVNAAGTAGDSTTTLELNKFSDRVPVVFDNVLFTNGSLSQ